VFAPVGRSDGRAMIQRIRSACGYHENRFAYDAHGRLTQIRDSGGRIIELRCDARGRLTELRLPKPIGEGHDVHRRFEYDDEGDLVQVTDVLGGQWRYAYVTHLLTQEQNRRGLSFYFAYDGIGEDAWCVRTWGDGGIYDHVLSYDKRNHVTCVTNSLGHTTVYRMNVAGQVVEILDAFGTKTSYEYDPHTLKQLREVDGLGRTTTWRYDPRGNVTHIDRPDGSSVELGYDERNLLVHGRDPAGTEWTWRYDSLGRINERCSADGSRTHYRYEGGYLTTIIDPTGSVSSVGYDAHGMLDALRTAEGAVTQWSYDALGRAVRVADAQGNAQARSFDLLGRAIEVREADGNVRRLEYDREGGLVRLTDANQPIEYAYVGMGRVATRTQAGTTVTFEYDSEEQLSAIRNQHGLAYSFSYDQRGELTGEVGFDGRARKYKRDAEGQIVTVARASGLETHYRYDPGGRIVEIDHGKGEIESFCFRSDGLIVEAKNAVALLRFERDALGRIVREWQNQHWIESQYDAHGRRIGLRSSLGAVHEIERNQMGDVVALRHRDAAPIEAGEEPGLARPDGSARPESADWEARFHRDATGEEIERSLPGGVRARWSRDKLGRPLRQQVWSGDAVHRDVQYEWSVDDRLRGLLDAVHGLQVSYGHDALGRLSWAKYVGQQEFGDLRLPDAVGNLFRSAARDDREYGPAGQLLAVHTPAGTRRYVYDAEGNLIERCEPSGEVWRYEWSAAGRLRAVERPDGKRVEFEYDPIGRRLSKRFDGNITRFVWDGHRPLHEWIEADAPARPVIDVAPIEPELAQQDALERVLAGRPSRGPPPTKLITWLFEPDSHIPIAKIVDGERNSIVCDYLGAPVSMFDAAGRKVWAAEYDARGGLRELECSAPADRHACPFRWPGQYEDAETGLHYNRFRYYDPEAGQYTSQDPLGLRAGLAAYAYVDDPLSSCDVFGLIAGPPYDFATLLHEAKNTLDFKTNPNGAVFWSGPRMADAQAWARANGKTTLEQTTGGQMLDSLKLFDSGSGLTGQQAAEIWDAASLRFAKEATGEVSVFSTGAKRMNNWGNLRTWWRVEKPALDVNPKVTNIVRRRKDGTPCA
jgi:RHS repeat-associated protein